MTCNFDNNIIDIGRGLAFVIGVIIGIIIHSKMGEKLPKVDIEGGGEEESGSGEGAKEKVSEKV